MTGVLYAKVAGSWVPIGSTGAPPGIQTVVAGANVTVDTTDSIRPVVAVPALPKGRVGYVGITSTVNVPTVTGLMPGFTVTVPNMDTTRRYIVTAKLSAQSTVANDIIRYTLVADGGQVDLAQMVITVVNQFQGPVMLYKSYDTGGLAGSHTFTVNGVRQAGTGTCQAIGQTGIPLYIEVQDNGAA